MKNIIKTVFLSSIGLLFYSTCSFAGTGYCTPVDGTESMQYDFGSYTITDPTKNVPGTVAPEEKLEAASGKVTLNCSCDGGPYTHVFLYGDTTLSGKETVGNYNYYDVPGNDYLQVGLTMYTSITGNWNTFPFGPISNNLSGSGGAEKLYCNQDFDVATGGSHTGSLLKVSLRIKQSFVGTSTISPVIVGSTYWNLGSDGGTSHGPTPATNIYISGSISVPQTCTINAGRVIPVDFGSIMADEFKKKGATIDSAQKTVIVPVKCTNIDASANLTLRLQALPAKDDNDFIRTSNPDIGVVVKNILGSVVKPNLGLIPFNLNDNSEAKVMMSVTPVSLTGAQPEPGSFYSYAYIRVDFE